MDSTITFINNLNFFMFILFTLLYSYKIVYILIAFKAKKDNKTVLGDVHSYKYAVVIAARNEELVISELIKSIKKQKYPEEFIDIFVVADNCTDNTAQAATESGAIVRERFNKEQIGKGYALDYMFNIIKKEYASREYDGFLVLDADNLLDKNYVAEMNKTFNQGYRVITSYRNSKNYDQNWISSGYALWFLHEAEYLNLPRMTIHTSCAISGTGFLVDADLIKRNGGWIHHLLTEDIEFTVSEILNGEKIGYSRNAVFYDEQPITFKQSWNQRLRWAKGFYQVIGNYGKDLIVNIFKGNGNSFASYDMAMTIMPAMLIACASIVINGVFFFGGLFEIFDQQKIIQATTIAMLKSVGGYYGILFIIGFITIVTEWKKIHCPGWKKVAYTFTFPLFMFTYLPIAIAALFKDVKWKPIAHTVVKSIDDVR
ncbi:glycosyltransferase family 2 protein [Virgibacillus sp. NKC19-16]|uniref:glycosyltransferase family 2 protein n=1 Tax=Virgibacillus salidurans TaxID=2831673 RepID=UPI001F28EB15|nr:glycosyltransferase family 2 protein [Virgibacillus sp. NKC19-16]UJL45237.1 glycosyltransferase family 2 protein [Virgibacillus sp. NKC19-16]